MAPDVCYKCGDEARDPVFFFKCVRCHRLQHTFCNSLYRDDEWHRFCERCLEEKPHQEETPGWVEDLVAVDFSAPCGENRFCLTCLKAFCCQSCPTVHNQDGGQGGFIQIPLRHDQCPVVCETDIQHFYDCTDIKRCKRSVQTGMQTEGRRFVLLRRTLQHPALHFEECGNTVGSRKEYCSIECKVQDLRLPVDMLRRQFVKALLGQDFRHELGAFCIECRTALCISMIDDHVNHHNQIIIIVPKDGRYFAAIPDEEEWVGNLCCAQVHDDAIPNVRLLPLTGLSPPNSCLCGNTVDGDLWYCSFRCMVRHHLLELSSYPSCDVCMVTLNADTGSCRSENVVEVLVSSPISEVSESCVFSDQVFQANDKLGSEENNLQFITARPSDR